MSNLRAYLRIPLLCAFIVFFGALGCDSGLTGIAERPQLRSLSFTRSTASATDDVILVATGAGEISSRVPPVGLFVRGTQRSQAGLNYWDQMSDEELARAIVSKGVDGRAAIGFKAADMSTGVNDAGEVLVSDEVVGRMVAWLLDQNIEIARQYSLIPSVVVDLDDPSADLVGTLRNHPNTDYLEPVISTERSFSTGFQNRTNRSTSRSTFAAVVEVSRLGTIESGDTVKAVYVQPDGTSLSTTLVVQ